MHEEIRINVRVRLQQMPLNRRGARRPPLSLRSIVLAAREEELGAPPVTFPVVLAGGVDETLGVEVVGVQHVAH